MTDTSSKRQIHTKQTSRYTLIELLVTIAIIGILTTLLLTVMGKAKEEIKRLQCVDNLKSHGAAMMGYAGDNNNDIVPPTLEYLKSLNPKNIGVSYDDLLSHYMGRGLSQASMEAGALRNNEDATEDPDVSDEVIQCPNDETYKQREEFRSRSYVMNGADLTDGDEVLVNSTLMPFFQPGTDEYKTGSVCATGVRPFKFSQLPDLAGTIIMTEKAGAGNYAGSRAVTTVKNGQKQTIGWNADLDENQLHGLFIFNYLFGDGHVDTLDAASLGGEWSIKDTD